MKRLIKIVLGTLFTIILLLLVIPLFVSADMLKEQLVSQASKATGRTVAIEGKTSLKLFPNIAVSAENVTIGNPAGFKSPHLVHAKTLATGAALRPLLSGHLNVTGITLEGANINLEETAAGTKNWEFTKQKAAESAQKSAKSSSAIKSFALGDVSVKDSAVNMIKPAETTTLDQINLTVRGADGRSSLVVEGDARYKGKTITLSSKIENPRAFLANEPSPAGIEVGLPGGKANFAGKAQLGDAMSAVGKLSLDFDDVPGLLAWATGKPGKGLPRDVDLKTDATIKGKKFSLKNTTLKMDDVTAAGNLDANLEGAVPSISGALKFGTLDLNKVMKTARTETSPGWMDAYAAEGKGWSSEPMDLSGLRAVNADLNITADKLIHDKLEVSDVSIHPQLAGGNLTLGITKASLYGGSATGTITASANGGQTVGADLNFIGIKMEPFLTALKGDTRLSGTASMKLNVKGSGASQQAIVSNLNGNGSIKVADGAIKGMNLAGFWRDLKQGSLFGSGSGSESTDFSELSGTFTIAQGIVSNSDLAMKSPALRVSGKGTVNLPARTVNYQLVPTVVQTLKGQGGKDKAGLEVPLNITGSIDNPSVVPDVAGLVQKQLADPEALKQNLKDLKGTIKNFNSPKDIGKALLGGGEETPAATTAPAATPAPAPAAAPAPAPTKEEQIMKGLGDLMK